MVVIIAWYPPATTVSIFFPKGILVGLNTFTGESFPSPNYPKLFYPKTNNS